MASNDLLSTLLSSGSLESLSEISGAGKGQVQDVLQSALPTLVKSMQKNASSKSGEAALTKAASDHAGIDTSNIGDILKNVDLEDGGKILTHILGDNKNTVANGIAKKSGLSADTIGTILSTAAPLLLSLLGNKQQEQSQNNNSGGGIMDILTSLLGGGNNDNSSNNDSGGGLDLGDIASTLLGGGNNNSNNDNGNGGVLGDLLGAGIGALLGGGTKKKSSSGRKKSTSSGKRKPTSTTKKKPTKKKR